MFREKKLFTVGHQCDVPFISGFLIDFFIGGCDSDSSLASLPFFTITSIVTCYSTNLTDDFGRLLSFGSGRLPPFLRVLGLGHRSCISKECRVIVDIMISSTRVLVSPSRSDSIRRS
jgi:hypothetical protein